MRNRKTTNKDKLNSIITKGVLLATSFSIFVLGSMVLCTSDNTKGVIGGAKLV